MNGEPRLVADVELGADETPMSPEVALREYLDRRMDDLQTQIDRRLKDLETRFADKFEQYSDAVDKAETSIDRRLNSMNEFRDALRDQAGRMATRVELEKLDEAVNIIQRERATKEELGRMEGLVHELRRAKAHLDGRLVVVTGSISIAVSVALWLISRFMATP